LVLSCVLMALALAVFMAIERPSLRSRTDGETYA